MADEGLYGKFVVTKNGEPIEDCFVLRPDRDQAARVALLAYAAATTDLALRGDLHDWVHAINEAMGPEDRASVMRQVFEQAVADAARRASAARGEAAMQEMFLADARKRLTGLADPTAQTGNRAKGGDA